MLLCRGGGAAVAKTLDLIKTLLQPSLNLEVKRLCDSYRHIFDMAASNILENTGDTVPSATLHLLIAKMLDEVRRIQWMVGVVLSGGRWSQKGSDMCVVFVQAKLESDVCCIWYLYRLSRAMCMVNMSFLPRR